MTDTLPHATLRETAALLRDVVGPLVAMGVMIRRPAVMGLVQGARSGRRAVRRMQQMRDRYDGAALRLATPGRDQVLLLSASDMRRVLEGAPEPFSPSTPEKRAALGHFEPDASLVSTPPERAGRRAFNDAVLESDRGRHSMADALVAAVDVEAERLAGGDRLDWDGYHGAWSRAARAVVLGEGARGDDALTGMLDALRGDGNWAFLRPRRDGLRERFHDRLRGHLERAEGGSLAARIAARPQDPDMPVADQVTHWLFAFDAAAIAGFRALTLLAVGPERQARVAEEPSGGAMGRAAIRESLRLWPTTPAILREATADVALTGGTVAAGSHVVIYAPFFHRDDATVADAHRFVPERWTGAEGVAWPFVPFSGGPARCPAHDLVPMLAGAMLGGIAARARVAAEDAAGLAAAGDLPGIADHTAPRLTLAPR